MSQISVDIEIDLNMCKGCHLCVEICPTNVLKISSSRTEKGIFPPAVANLDNCKRCRLCEYICPDFAIELVDEYLKCG